MRKLVDEPVRKCSPTLAVIFGDREAMFLEQVHYWLNNPCTSKNIYDDERWVINSYEHWQDNFPWLSVITLKRIVKRLKDSGVLIVEVNKKNRFSRIQMYRIDYNLLDELIDEYKNTLDFEAETQFQSSKEKTPHNVNLTPSISYHSDTLSTQINSQTTSEIKISQEKSKDFLKKAVGENKKENIESSPSNSIELESENNLNYPNSESVEISPKKETKENLPKSNSEIASRILGRVKEKKSSSKPKKLYPYQIWKNALLELKELSPKEIKFTGKDKGQLNHAKDHLQDEFENVVFYVVEHWLEFASTVRRDIGANNMPISPNIAYFSRYCDKAMQLYLKHIKSPNTANGGVLENRQNTTSRNTIETTTMPDWMIKALEECN